MGRTEPQRDQPRPAPLANATALLIRAQSGEARRVLDEVPSLLSEAESARARDHAQWLRFARFAAYHNLRELADAEATAQEIIRLAESFDDRVWEVLGHALHATSLLLHGRTEAGYDQLARTVVLLEELQQSQPANDYATGHAINATAIALGQLELHELASCWLDRLNGVADDLGDTLLRTLCALNSGWLHLIWAFELDLLGDREEARAHYEANLGVFRAAPHDVDAVNRSSWPSEVVVQACAARAMLGEGRSLVSDLRPALDTVTSTQRFDVVLVGHLALARAHANDGDIDTALAHAERACEVSDDLPELRIHAGRSYWEYADLLRSRDGDSAPAAAFERLALRLIRSRWGERRSRVHAFEERLAAERARDELRRRAAAYLSDTLTGLGNRRLVEIKLPEMLVEASAARRPLTVAFVDIDDFKSVNDELSHLTGDEVLRELAQEMRSSLLTDDIVARFGGEEFVIVLANRRAAEAYALIDGLRRRIEARRWLSLPEGRTIRITAGLAESWMGATRTQILAAADEALLRAKRQGKNRVEIRAHPLPEN